MTKALGKDEFIALRNAMLTPGKVLVFRLPF